VSAARSFRHKKFIRDAYAGEDFALLEADRGCVVTTADGVPLVVREVGPVTAPLTVVFAHGFLPADGVVPLPARRACAAVGRSGADGVLRPARARAVQRGAGRDLYRPAAGQDLETILQVMVPRGPVVLVGHSMGGMTVLSHARQFPQHYGDRIVGAALISSAAEGLSRSPLGEILQNPALEAVRFAARYAPKMVHRTRGAARSVLRPILRTASFGAEAMSPSVVAFSEDMIHDTPIATLVEFLHAAGGARRERSPAVLARIRR